MNKNKVYFKDGHSESIYILEMYHKHFEHGDEIHVRFILNNQECEYVSTRELECKNFHGCERIILHIHRAFYNTKSLEQLDNIEYIAIEGAEYEIIRLPGDSC